ncbi:S8 family peptidase [Undibacterium sp. KW1]|uniref:S8 family peptidase n=1 Tax=Undibacterium sp. KW1 TaxID=2058624 RepID=UPI00210767AE|nr:S8 family peptidase [Undibacterium sp. KW1]
MTIRPQSLYSAEIPSEEPATGPAFPTQEPTRQCITALLDGYPVSGHAALVNRVTVHEVDVRGGNVPALSRNHGTAMASLIVHGDLQASTGAISRPVAIIPVLTDSGKAGSRETTPKGKLPIGVIYRALQALVASRGNPELAGVTVVNHSICDTYAPFVRRPSPWATLLDYFSHKHRLLFIVSAGNIAESFPLGDVYADLNEFNIALPEEREAALLLAINEAKATRGILSPAEAINGVTVGALHIDGAGPQASGIDPYPSVRMTNLASATGFGVNRSLKPDLVEQGGRFAAGCSNIQGGGGVKVHAQTAAGMGHQVASPSVSGDLTHVTRTAGTSNAAALVSRACNQIADAVEDAFNTDGTNWIDLPTRAVILKALLAHGTSWGDIGDILYDAYPPHESTKHAKRKDSIAKFIGYGRPNLERIISGTDNRITLLADDEIQHDQLHEYRVPLPTAMLNTRDVRSITLTLSWSTPVVTHSVDYRGVALKLVNPDGKSGFWKGVARQLQPVHTTSERGTLLHIKLEGGKLIKTAQADGIFIGVQAMARHVSQHGQPIPYALAITLEMGQSLQTGIYNEVQQEIRARNAARATTRVGART